MGIRIIAADRLGYGTLSHSYRFQTNTLSDRTIDILSNTNMFIPLSGITKAGTIGKTCSLFFGIRHASQKQSKGPEWTGKAGPVVRAWGAESWNDEWNCPVWLCGPIWSHHLHGAYNIYICYPPHDPPFSYLLYE